MSEQEIRVWALQMVREATTSSVNGHRPTVAEALSLASDVANFILTGKLPPESDEEAESA